MLLKNFYRLGLFLGLLAVLILPQIIVAHGGGTPQLTNVEFDSNLISVWTEPEPLTTGEVHLTVSVANKGEATQNGFEPGLVILDALVNVAFYSLDDPELIIQAQATHDTAANKFFYEAQLEIPQPGRWEVRISINDVTSTPATTFVVDILPASTSNDVLTQSNNQLWILGFMALGLIGFVGYIIISRRKTVINAK